MKLIVTIALLVVAGAALIDAKGPPEVSIHKGYLFSGYLQHVLIS